MEEIKKSIDEMVIRVKKQALFIANAFDIELDDIFLKSIEKMVYSEILDLLRNGFNIN